MAQPLKVATTVTLLAGVGMLLAWSSVVGEQPEASAPKEVLARYAIRLSVYFTVTVFMFLATSVLAYFVVRQTRIEYAAERIENLQSLMEGTLRDHDPRTSASDDAPRD